MAQAVCLGWAGLAAFWALWVLLPVPLDVLWLPAVFVIEFSLVLGVFALLGIGGAVTVWLLEGAWTGRLTLAVVLGLFAVGAALVPPLSASRTARAEGVGVALASYFSGINWVPQPEPTERTMLYATVDGVPLYLDAWTPERPGPEPRPAVVMVHGGGWQLGARSETPRWNRWLNDRGYAVFDIDYRPSPPPTWQAAPGDVKCAIGWVKDNAGRYGVDPDRIVVMGGSAGGHLALLAALAPEERQLAASCATGDTTVRAVVALYPPTDLVFGYNYDGFPPFAADVYGYQLLEDFTGGTPRTAPDAYAVASPIRYVDPQDPPVLIIQGGLDQGASSTSMSAPPETNRSGTGPGRQRARSAQMR